MAVAMGFGGVGNKNQGFSGSTGGGAIQPKLQLNSQGQLTTDGSGGFLNYLQGLLKPAAAAPAAAAAAPAAAAAAPAAAAAAPAAAGAAKLVGGL